MQTQGERTLASRRTWQRLAALGVVALVATVALVRFAGGSDAKPLVLSLGESSSLASCLAFDPAILADMPMAFAATATEVDGQSVTLTVDRWYKGGDAGSVTLVAEHQSPALIAGFDFVAGERYLVSAHDGTVNYCGFSGPETPELLAGYQAAFGG